MMRQPKDLARRMAPAMAALVAVALPATLRAAAPPVPQPGGTAPWVFTAVLTGPAAASDAPRAYVLVLDRPGVLDRLGAPPVTAIRGANLSALRAEVLAAQAPLVAALAERGIEVLDRYGTLLSGLLVRVDPARAAGLASLPGVASVEALPPARPDLARARAHLRADLVQRDVGLDGAGSLIAVVDTGIDYRHAALGGDGDPQAYRADDPSVVEAGTFPNAVVVGGVDLAGSTYAADCPRFPPPELVCSPRPSPDDDPIDEVYLDGFELQGHGSHVASIAAGRGSQAQGAAAVAPGIAPGASLLAIKIFGSPRGTGDEVVGETDLTLSGLEWAARHNLGEALEFGVPAVGPDGARRPIDVLNLSIGSPYGAQSALMDRAVGHLADLGVTVVASAGNSGDKAFSVGSPGASPAALSVGASFGPGSTQPRLEAAWSGGTLAVEAAEAVELLTPRLSATGPLRGQSMAYVGEACPGADGRPVPPWEDPAGKVALIARGRCLFVEKLARAQELGAVAAVVYTTGGAPPLMMRGDCGRLHGRCFTLPALMIDQISGERLKTARQGGAEVTVTLEDRLEPGLTDKIAAGTSRGPARFSMGLKPQLTAPGAGVHAASAGGGSEGLLRGGSSMAAPQVAGVAALLRQRQRRDHLTLGALDLAAMIMNQARPVIHGGSGAAVAVTRQGAGLPDALASARADLVARSDAGIAELGFGLVSTVAQPLTVRRAIRVTNLGGTPRRLEPRARLRSADDEGKGLRLRFEPTVVEVPASSGAALEAILEVDPNGLRPWNLPGRGRAEALLQTAVLDALEVDGQIELVAAEGGTEALASLPFHAVARRRSCVDLAWNGRAPGAGEPYRLLARNDCPEAGGVAVYRRLAADAPDPAAPGPLDLLRVGVRTFTLPPAARDPSHPDLPLKIMELLLETRGEAHLPMDREPRVYFDLQGDGRFDKVGQVHIFEGPILGSFVTAVDPVSLRPDWAGLPRDPNGGVRFFVSQLPYDLDERSVVLRFFLNHPDFGLGRELADLADLRLAVVLLDRFGDHPIDGAFPGLDALPEGFDMGASLPIDLARGACLDLRCPTCAEPVDGSTAELIDLPGGQGRAELELRACGGVPAGPLLAHSPTNLGDHLIWPIDLAAAPSAAYLPSLRVER